MFSLNQIDMKKKKNRYQCFAAARKKKKLQNIDIDDNGNNQK